MASRRNSRPSLAPLAQRYAYYLGLPDIEAEECGAAFDLAFYEKPLAMQEQLLASPYLLKRFAWRFACNALRSYLHRLAHEIIMPLEAELTASEELSVEEVMEREEIVQAVWRALESLEPLVRSWVWAHEIEGWTYEELGQREGKSAEAVRKACERGESRLRAALLEAGLRLEPRKDGRVHIALYGGR